MQSLTRTDHLHDFPIHSLAADLYLLQYTITVCITIACSLCNQLVFQEGEGDRAGWAEGGGGGREERGRGCMQPFSP